MIQRGRVMKKVYGILLVFLLTFLVACTNEVQIQFESNGGIEVESVAFESNDIPNSLPEPTKEGYAFDGWYLDSELTEEVVLDEINKSTTLYAKWIQINYSIEYLDYEGEVVESFTFHFGDDLSSVDVPTLEDTEAYLFLDWEEDLPDTMPSHDIVISPDYVNLSAEIAIMFSYTGVSDSTMSAYILAAVMGFSEEQDLSYSFYLPFEETNDSREIAIEFAISMGAKIVICVGYLYEVAVYNLQTEYPDISFLLVDGQPHNEAYTDYTISANTVAVTFKAEEAAFLAGYAAVMEGYRNLGFVGGMAIPIIMQYGYGFIQGAEYAANELGLTAGDVHINYYYANAFEASEQLDNRLSNWATSGVEIVFPVIGAGVESAILVAEEFDTVLIGVEVDQYLAQSEVFVTSAMNNYGQITYDLLTTFYENDGEWYEGQGGNILHFGIAEDAVMLPTFVDSWQFENFTLEEYQDIYNQIKNGIISVNDDYSTQPMTTYVDVNYES